MHVPQHMLAIQLPTSTPQIQKSNSVHDIYAHNIQNNENTIKSTQLTEMKCRKNPSREEQKQQKKKNAKLKKMKKNKKKYLVMVHCSRLKKFPINTNSFICIRLQSSLKFVNMRFCCSCNLINVRFADLLDFLRNDQVVLKMNTVVSPSNSQ